MASRQDELIQTYKDESGERQFAVMTGSRSKIFAIKDMKCCEFYHDICKETQKFNFSEVLPLTGEIPLMAEFHFTFHDQHGDGIWYQDEFISIMIDILYEIIEENFETKDNDPAYNCIYSESEPVRLSMKDETRVSVRFHFPMCRMKYKLYTSKIYPQILRKVMSEKVSDLFIHSMKNRWEDALYDFTQNDKVLIPVIGSEYDGYNPLIPAAFIDRKMDNDETVEDFPLSEMVSAGLIPEQHSMITLRKTNSRCVVTNPGDDGNYYWAAFIMSHDFTQKLMRTHSIETEKPKKKNNFVDFDSDMILTDKPLDLMKFFLNYISPERFKDRTTFTDIGQIIFISCHIPGEYHIYDPEFSKTPPYGLKLWLSLAAKYNYCEDDCIEIWNRFSVSKSKLSIKRLAEYMRDDNPAEYQAWHHKWCLKAYEEALTELVDNTLAAAFYRTFWLRFIFDPETGKNDKWYEFDGVRLKPVGLTRMFAVVRSEFLDKWRDLLAATNEAGRGAKLTETEEKLNMAKLDNIRKVMKKIQNAPDRKKLIETASTYFYIPAFEDFKNADHLLMGTENCILQIVPDVKGKGKHIIKRKGYIEDYVTFSTMVPYRNFTENHPQVKRVRKIWADMMNHDPQMERRLHHKMSALLQGKNTEKFFSVATGDGDNGKSIFFKMQQRALGNYYAELPLEIITTKQKSSSGARPELMYAKGTRLAVISEHDKSALLAVLVKILTGGDDLPIRSLFQEIKRFIQTYHLYLQTNDPPEFDDPARSIKARVDILPFIVTFVDEAPATLEEQIKTRQYPKDNDLDEEINSLGSAVLWCMVNDFHDYSLNNLKKDIPPYITEYMKNYWDENDMFTGFINDCLTIDNQDKSGKGGYLVRGTHGSVNHREIYKVFQVWFKQERPGNKVPESKFVLKSLKDPTRLGAFNNPKKKLWTGVGINQEMIDMLSAE